MTRQFKVGQFVGGKGLSKSIDRIDRVVKKDVLLQVGVIKGAFRVGGHQEHGGLAWAPLASSTIKRKERMGKTNILLVTGELRNSIHGGVRVVNRAKYVQVVGTNVAYAPFHQSGVKRKARAVKAYTSYQRYERGSYKTNKAGKTVWKKGKLLRDENKNLKPIKREIKATKRTSGMPARPPIIKTRRDEERTASALDIAVNESINGNMRPKNIKKRGRR